MLLAPLTTSLPILLALLMSWQWGWQAPEEPAGSLLRAIEVANSNELAALFREYDYQWPPQQAVPPLGLQAFPGDLGSRPTDEKKTLFFQSLLPLVLAENARLREKRHSLTALLERHTLTEEERQYLQRLLERYKLEPLEQPRQAIETLLLHIDQIPVALVLAQAANESGWGGSRFVLEGNNLFGEWTWIPEEGIAPRVRNANSRHYVRRFDSLFDSVQAYMYNLNAGHAYVGFRGMRATMRANERDFDPLILATGLLGYSARGEEYIAEIQTMILGNRLDQLESLELDG